MTDSHRNLIDITITFAKFDAYFSHWELPKVDHDYLIYRKLEDSLKELGIGGQHPRIDYLGGAKGSEFGGPRYYYTLNTEDLKRLIQFAHDWAFAHEHIVQMKSFHGSTVLLRSDPNINSTEIENAVKVLVEDNPKTKPRADEGELFEAAFDQRVLISLRHILQTRFNESELRQLVFDLGIDFEKLEGNNHPDRVISLLYYLKRRENLSVLIDLGKSLRDDIAWPKWMNYR